MVDFVNVIDKLGLGVLQENTVLKEAAQTVYSDVHVLGEGRADYRSLLNPVVAGQIGASAAKTYAQGRTADNHGSPVLEE
jgi:hypothetical protein